MFRFGETEFKVELTGCVNWYTCIKSWVNIGSWCTYVNLVCKCKQVVWTLKFGEIIVETKSYFVWDF